MCIMGREFETHVASSLNPVYISSVCMWIQSGVAIFQITCISVLCMHVLLCIHAKDGTMIVCLSHYLSWNKNFTFFILYVTNHTRYNLSIYVFVPIPVSINWFILTVSAKVSKLCMSVCFNKPNNMKIKYKSNIYTTNMAIRSLYQEKLWP